MLEGSFFYEFLREFRGILMGGTKDFLQSSDIHDKKSKNVSHGGD